MSVCTPYNSHEVGDEDGRDDSKEAELLNGGKDIRSTIISMMDESTRTSSTQASKAAKI
jgi:hypothetical protein